MSFAKVFSPQAIARALERAEHAKAADVRAALDSGAPDAASFAALLSPQAASMLEEIAQAAHRATVARFGKTIALYAPLYLSNDCVCTCTYCGFSLGLDIARKTLRIDEVMREAQLLAGQGFRNLLLVSSEHPKLVPPSYVAQCVRETKRVAHYVALEIAAAEVPEYRQYVEAGCDGVVLYQETYDPEVYARHHQGGPKKRYAWRMDALERAAEAGVRHLGAGVLLGLADWRFDGLALIEHARYLQRHAWRSVVNVSLPRINPAAGDYTPAKPVSDAQFVQLICALRIALPMAGIVLSTRETAALRDRLVPLGITHMSAGSSTEPGGYAEPGTSGEQFHLEDVRSSVVVAHALRELGYDPVFKDWELMAASAQTQTAGV
ncbi:MAG: 2-iminoacetate synthase ThiH [Candidatus Eremiobacteraeota bacterium]|nr:2-iminoacetate synthase ThiH [Candidatus Eremiobacteraeota bacterium]MBV8263948.1 2-iminoacetate synthase ThiH [Candidatus Eremiobacteraeota bacterium]